MKLVKIAIVAAILNFSLACKSPDLKQVEQQEIEEGPHHGHLLTDGNLSAELTIFETGVEPQFRIYTYENGELLDPVTVKAQIKITRPVQGQQVYEFSPMGDFLLGDQVVAEPHSFMVNLEVATANGVHTWQFPNFEWQTELEEEVAKASGVKVEVAGSGTLGKYYTLRGKVVPSEHKIAHIVPRFSGVVREGRKHIGDQVKAGEVMAIIESNESLQPFELKSQISGTVINGHLIVGEFVSQSQWVYVVADLSEVWVDFYLPLKDKDIAQLNQAVVIKPVNSKQSVSGSISYLAPYVDEKSQSRLVRVIIKNDKEILLPGMYVTGQLLLSEKTAEVVIPKAAVQTLFKRKVVFVKEGNRYQAVPIEIGDSSPTGFEVLSGLKPGNRFVAENSYLIKADILKSGATHDH